MGIIITTETDVVWHYTTGDPSGRKNASGHLQEGTIEVVVPENALTARLYVTGGLTVSKDFTSTFGWPITVGGVTVERLWVDSDGETVLSVSSTTGNGVVKIEYDWEKTRPIDHAEYTLDVRNWTGTKECPAGVFTEIVSLPWVKVIDANVVSITGSTLKFPAMDGLSTLVFAVRLTGTYPTQSEHTWSVIIRRPTGQVLSVVQEADNKVSFSTRETTIHSYIADIDDPFVTSGVVIGVENTSSQALTLTAITLRIERIFNV